jgi:hypothetical protein
MAASKFQGVCSVCLRTMQLHGDRPIRHGFSAIGVKHGTHSGYHTGPCGGSNFPHLGISTEGTVWALGVARRNLEQTREALRRLETNPDLTYFSKGIRGYSEARSQTVRYGDEADYKPATAHPGYAHLHYQRVAEETARERELERAIAAYEKVLVTWEPKTWEPKQAPAKVETTHLAKEIHSPRLGDWTGISCRATRPGYATTQLKKTMDPAKVTCKRCKAILGLPTT